MVTRQKLEKKISKYKEEIATLSAEGEKQDRNRLRTFRKRLKRSQRKLAALVRNEERVAGKSGGEKKKG